MAELSSHCFLSPPPIFIFKSSRFTEPIRRCKDTKVRVRVEVGILSPFAAWPKSHVSEESTCTFYTYIYIFEVTPRRSFMMSQHDFFFFLCSVCKGNDVDVMRGVYGTLIHTQSTKNKSCR